MNKNPFSIYDFMGYLFPGVVCSIFLYLLFHFNGDLSKLTDILLMKEALSSSDTKFDLDRSIIFIVFSYILGHIVSYTSSLTVEQFAVKVFEYPSAYLLQRSPKTYGELWKNFFTTQSYSSVDFMRIIKILLRFVLKVLIFLSSFLYVLLFTHLVICLI